MLHLYHVYVYGCGDSLGARYLVSVSVVAVVSKVQLLIEHIQHLCLSVQAAITVVNVVNPKDSVS